MKILIASDTYFPSVNGAAYFTYRLANELAKKNHQVSVLCPSVKFKNTITEETNLTTYGLKSIHIPVYQNFRMSPPILCRKTVRKLIKKINPDVIHVQNHFLIGKEVINVATNLKIPIIGTNHFMPENLVHYFHLPDFAENWLKKFGWNQCIHEYEKLDLVTTPTNTAAKLLKEAGFKKDIITISCGIDLDRFNSKNDGSYLREKYSIPNNKPILLYVGRLDKEKKIDVIIKALSQILKKIDTHLILAGIGEDKKNIEKLIAKYNATQNVTFTGFIPDEDLQNIYNIGDIFVIASIAELQSIVTMEAMATGLPVVAADAGALPELVHDDKNGYLFPDGNSMELADKIISILNNEELKIQMQQESLKIINKHDLRKIITKYESLYTKIATK